MKDDLKKLAGDCLNETQCKKCAQMVGICSQRYSVINHCDRRITLFSDTDMSFGLFKLFI